MNGFGVDRAARIFSLLIICMSFKYTKEKLEPLQHLTMKEATRVLGCTYHGLYKAAIRLGLQFKEGRSGPKPTVERKPRIKKPKPVVEPKPVRIVVVKPPVQPPYETVGMTQEQLGVTITVLPPVPRDQPAKFKSRFLTAGQRTAIDGVKLKRGRPRKVA
jgi:hypothetical protein